MHRDVPVPRSAGMRESGLRAALKRCAKSHSCDFVNILFGSIFPTN
jgi:hypothetical protein